jgi:tRNA 2-thiouridine synthesizing protein A
MAEITLDARGLACPMPIVKLAKAAKDLASGDQITVLADDPGFEPDVKAWVETQGHELASLAESDGVFTAVVTLK